MILAELHGKIPSKLTDKEDLLTSNVFSFFKYSNRELFWEYLNLLGIEVSLADSQKAEFHFWPIYDDGTEPDLVVICGDYYILFEAKLYSDFSQKTDKIEAQIDREIKMGKLSANNLNKNFVYVPITAEYYKNKTKYLIYENSAYQLIWTNWHTVASFIYLFQEERHLTHDLEFLSDLYLLLVKKKLRWFISINNINLETPLGSNSLIFYDFKTSKFKGEFSGFIEILSKHGQIKKYLLNFKKSFFHSLPKLNFRYTTKLFYGS